MAKYYGAVGYASTVETSPGVWEEQIVEKYYYGDLVRNIRRLSSPDKINEDIDISNVIEIVSDPYAMTNFHAIRYAVFMGTKWKVTSVEVRYPRLELTLGGLYHG